MCVVAGFIGLLAGCSSDDHAKEIKKEKSKNSTPGLKLRFAQLNATLNQLEQETEIQKKHVASARAELQAIQDLLSKGRLEDIALAEFVTTAVVIAPVSVHDRKLASSDEEKESATDNVFRTLVIVLFALFAIVYLAKLWRDRDYAPSTPEDYTRADAAPAGTGGTYYTSPADQASAGGQDESTSTPPLT